MYRMNQKLLTLHTLTPQAFLIAIAVALAACFSGVAWAGDASASDARTLTAKSDTTPIYLEIAPRRQWDCNYGMNGLSPCKCPGNPNDKNFADTDTYGCWDSCLDSPEPDQPGDDSSDSYLSVSDCHCGEGQATLAGLCTKRAGARACRVKAKRGPGLNGNFKDASSSTPQLPNCSGFCGANSIQQAALYQGAYVSQGLIRLLGKGNDPPHDDNAYTALQLLIDQDRGKRDVHDVVDTLGFKTDRWYPESGLASVAGALSPRRVGAAGDFELVVHGLAQAREERGALRGPHPHRPRDCAVGRTYKLASSTTF